jgi:hypothetical protein
MGRILTSLLGIAGSPEKQPFSAAPICLRLTSVAVDQMNEHIIQGEVMQQIGGQATLLRPDAWEGDHFQRHQFADFLTEYLKAKSQMPGGVGLQPFSLALNAGWGRGKSFFVRGWTADLAARSPRHPVMFFNAWAADVSTDPLVAFMAAFKSALDQEVEKLDATGEAKLALRQGVEKIVKGVRRAYLPAAKVVLKGLVKKISGVAVDEVTEALETGDIEIHPDRIEELKAEGLKAAEKGLDEFFMKALAEQSDLAKVISDLRATVESTLAVLAAEGGLVLPMFVFVDELDRCRPPFAIALLEGIKHLFGVKGVCYVVSTNIDQLAKATGAIYGPGFDGSGYLKRFFDVQCELPMPSPLAFVESLFAASSIMTTAAQQGQIKSGMPDGGLKETGWGDSAQAAFCWVAEEFDLDFRSQQQVFTALEASASALANQGIHLLWLATLCALRQRSPTLFERVARREMSTETAWSELHVISKSYTRAAFDPNGQGSAEANVTLREVAAHFYSNAFKLAKANSRVATSGYDYPNRWLQHLKQADKNGGSELLQYFSTVRSAGFISST